MSIDESLAREQVKLTIRTAISISLTPKVLAVIWKEYIDLKSKDESRLLVKDHKPLFDQIRKHEQLPFKRIFDYLLRYTGEYRPGRKEEIRQILIDQGLSDKLEVDGAILVEYEKKDFTECDLLVVDIPEIWLDGGPFKEQVACPECSHKRESFDYENLVDTFSCRYDFVCVDAIVEVAHKKLRGFLENDLGLKDLRQFDRKGDWYLVEPPTNLGTIANPPGDFVEYKGICSECSHPTFTKLLGPSKYDRGKYSGELIVAEQFYQCSLFSHRAFELIKKTTGTKVSMCEPVYLV